MKGLMWLCVLLAAGVAHADPTVVFEGELADDHGVLVTDNVLMTFSLYSSADDAAPLWTETQPLVMVTAGKFTVPLGSITPFGDVLFTDRPLYVGLSIDGGDELQPRNLLTEVPRAAAALWAADVTGQDIHPRSVSVGGATVIDENGHWVGPGGAGAADYRYHFASLAAGDQAVCGLDADGHATCWGQNATGQGRPPPVTFRSIALGAGFGCGIRDTGELICWGRNQFGELAVPFGQFTQVDAGLEHACAVDDGGSVHCWGLANNGNNDPPAGAFTSVAEGGSHSCALAADGTATCWGDNGHGECDVPAGTHFARLAAGWAFTCGILDSGALRCWGGAGGANDPIASPPAGRFTDLSAGGQFACAIRDDGETACWGTDEDGETLHSGPGLTALAAGGRFACGLRPDGTANCWGNPDSIDVRPPER